MSVIADKLKSEDGQRARSAWVTLGEMAFEAERKDDKPIVVRKWNGRA